MLTDQEKQDYNEVVKARYKQIGEKQLDTKGFTVIRYYNEKLYCREDDCQELTNQAFTFRLWMIAEMIGKDPSKGKYPFAVMHLPLCDKHIAERAAHARTT